MISAYWMKSLTGRVGRLSTVSPIREPSASCKTSRSPVWSSVKLLFTFLTWHVLATISINFPMVHLLLTNRYFIALSSSANYLHLIKRRWSMGILWSPSAFILIRINSTLGLLDAFDVALYLLYLLVLALLDSIAGSPFYYSRALTCDLYYYLTCT